MERWLLVESTEDVYLDGDALEQFEAALRDDPVPGEPTPAWAEGAVAAKYIVHSNGPDVARQAALEAFGRALRAAGAGGSWRIVQEDLDT